MTNAIKRFISRFTNRQIHIGYSVSTDDSLKLGTMPTDKQIEDAENSITAKYYLRGDIGRFEIVGIIRLRNGISYQLRHILTGEVFNITKAMFTLLFVKSD